MIRWAVCNQKGGVGKTTTVVSLGGLLAAKRQRVLLVDLDPQGSMTSYFGLDPDSIETSVYPLFESRVQGARWALSCERVGELIELEADDVKWRSGGSLRPWLAGTARDRSCALLDIGQLGRLLTERMA